MSVVSVAARTISTRAVAALTARLLLRQDVLRHGTVKVDQRFAAGEVQSALIVDFKHLDLHDITDIDDIRDVLRALDVELRDMHKAFLPGAISTNAPKSMILVTRPL